jgi:alkylation response protein AidB-like acyl-CoA dehydrogenase
MDLDFTPDQIEFRDQVRTWLDENKPTEARPRDDAGIREYDLAWQRTQWKGGWAGIAWPTQYGGKGLTLLQQLIWYEEYAARGFPGIDACFVGLSHAGPTLITRGVDEQKSFHLPKILRGEVIWCQGFSEPEAGTDLASLRTRAVPDGDGWRITGQKVWTSYAQMASWCVLAACTDPNAPKANRLSLFLVPMDRAGITVRPIRSMLGPHHLNEVFLDGVEVFPDEVLGELGDGWRVMREALAFERVGIARYARCESLLDRMQTELGDNWDELPESIRTRWVRALIDLRIARLLAYRAVSLQDDPSAGAAASAARIATTTCDQQVAELLFDVLGPTALDSGSSAALHGAVEDHWRYAQAATVASGTIEVQRMLVARETLGAHR